MPTTNPYTELQNVGDRAEVIVAVYRGQRPAPAMTQRPSAEYLATHPEAARAWRAADISDAVDSLLDAVDGITGTESLVRTAASTLGRILRGIER